MASKLEQCLEALATLLSGVAVLPNTQLKRNEPEPDDIDVDQPATLYMIDGEPPEAPIETAMGIPPTYFWQHVVDLYFSVAHDDEQVRRTTVDTLFMKVQELIDSDPRLGGLADYIETLPKSVDHVSAEGATTVISARTGVVLHYNSTSALG